MRYLSKSLVLLSFLLVGCQKAGLTTGQLFDAVMTNDKVISTVKTIGVDMQQVGNRSNYTQFSGFNAPQTVFVDVVVDKGKPIQISTDVSGDALKSDLNKIIKTSFIDPFNLNNEDVRRLNILLSDNIDETDHIELWNFTIYHSPNSIKIVATDIRYSAALGDKSIPSRKLAGLPTTVSIGMKSSDVSDILGFPEHQETTTTLSGTSEVWTYSDGTTITFINDAVTVIQQDH